MRVFEIKVCGTAKLEHVFIRDDEHKISGSDVTLDIFATVSENENIEEEGSLSIIDDDEYMLMDGATIYNATTKAYEHNIDLADTQWALGSYLLRWNAVIDGNDVSEFDKLCVVAATRADMAAMLEMPSSISAGGITISYTERLANMQKSRAPKGIKVGRTTKDRTRINRDTSERDYDR